MVKNVELKIELQTKLLGIHAVIPQSKLERSMFWNNWYAKFLMEKELARKTPLEVLI